MIEHLLSKGHWINVQTRALRRQNLCVEKVVSNQAKLQALPDLIQHGAVVAIAQASLPFTAGIAILGIAQKSVGLISNNHPIPACEIYEARRRGLSNLANAGDRINALHTPVNKNQHGFKKPIILHQTQVSQRIQKVGKDIVSLKINFFKNCAYTSIFVDESTTVGMQTRPVYCGAIGINEKFEWLMCFVGQTNTAGCETGEIYFNTVKDVYSIYNIWSKKKALVLMDSIQ